jgi:hypothetical protein
MNTYRIYFKVLEKIDDECRILVTDFTGLVWNRKRRDRIARGSGTVWDWEHDGRSCGAYLEEGLMYLNDLQAICPKRLKKVV